MTDASSVSTIMYNAYFGFEEKPFTVTPDPRFFYPNPLYCEAYATLTYGIRERKGFVLLSGEVGTGKTTLLRRLMNDLDANIRFVFFYNTTLTFEELVSVTCHELGLAVRDGGRLQKIQALNEFLIEQLRKGGTGVLLIDEAQNLREDVLESLRLLSNLETASEKLIQIVLVGQPELEAKLDQPNLRQLKQRIALRCRLDRLKDREVGSFIDHRLRTVGYERGDLFLPEAVRDIARYSKGIPRLINMICDNALLIAYGTSRKTVSAEMIEEVACDLRLKEDETIRPSSDETLSDEVSPPSSRSEELCASACEPVPAMVRQKPRRGGGARIWGFLGLVLLGGIATITAPLLVQDRTSALTLKLEGLLERVRGWVGSSQSHVMSAEAKRQEIHPLGGSEPSADLETKSESRDGWNQVGAPLALTEHAVPSPSSDVKKEAGEQANRASAPIPDPNLSTGKNEVADPTGAPQDRLPSVSSPYSASAKWKDQPIIIPYGATISEIAVKTYGEDYTLAIDLIKEFNPHIGNLNWVRAGERVRLPPLAQETLLRRDTNGRYRLILASPIKQEEARILQDALKRKGYDTVIREQKVSSDLVLYRVEIDGLKSPEAAHQVCRSTIARCRVLFAKEARPGGDNE